MKTVLVTGGCGYIGAHTCKYLAGRRLKVVVLDNLSTGFAHNCKWGELERGSIHNAGFALKYYKPDAVIHFAGAAYVGESIADPAKYYDTNVVGTLNLLEAMREQGRKIPLVFSSSCAIFAPDDHHLIEFDDKRPLSPYGRSKLMVEQILEDYDIAYGQPHVNLRYFNAAGADSHLECGEEHEPETHLIPLAIRAAIDQMSLTINGGDYPTSDGTCVRDYIHPHDLAIAHYLALEYLWNKNKSDRFNLGYGKGYSILQVIKAVEKATGLRVPVTFGPRREGDAPSLIANPSKAKDVLRWMPELDDIDIIIQTAYQWELHGKKRNEV